jgi:protein SCO1/2
MIMKNLHLALIAQLQGRLLPIVLMALLTAMTQLGCSEKKPSFHAVDITGAAYAQGFSLPGADGKTLTLKDFAGKVVVVFFGFTQCPDVCPTTLAEVSSVKKALGADGDKLQAVFITIDPERDTAPMLKAYVANFDPSFVALRPDSAEQLAAVAKEFKIYYKKSEGKSATSYTMDHTAASYVFDPKGNVRLFTRYGAGIEPLTSDIRQLIAGK